MTARARRIVILGFSHIGASIVGVYAFGLIAVNMLGPIVGPHSELGLAWATSQTASGCKPDLTPLARTLIAHRSELHEDDFAVEAAAILTLLRGHGDEMLAPADRRTLEDAAARCESVVQSPCAGARFESAVARRCTEGLAGSTAKTRVRADAGSPTRPPPEGGH
jgi:hypothetical protein